MRFSTCVPDDFNWEWKGGWKTRYGHKALFLRKLPFLKNSLVPPRNSYLWAIETSPDSGCYDYDLRQEDGTLYGYAQSTSLQSDIVDTDFKGEGI